MPSLWSGNATHVDLDPRSLAQGGVATRAAARVTIEADATQACAALIDALGGTTSSRANNAAKAVAAAKAASDSPGALADAHVGLWRSQWRR